MCFALGTWLIATLISVTSKLVHDKEYLPKYGKLVISE